MCLSYRQYCNKTEPNGQRTTTETVTKVLSLQVVSKAPASLPSAFRLFPHTIQIAEPDQSVAVHT
jgi:hypothetical protein